MADDGEFTDGGKTYSRGGLWTDAVEVSKSDTKAKTPTYRHAQKEAMKKGDSSTYFMRKTSKKAAAKSRSK